MPQSARIWQSIRENFLNSRHEKSELNVEKEKLEIIKWLTSLKDKIAIGRLRMLREHPKNSEWWNEITDEEKTAIDKRLEDIKAGRIKPHKVARKLYEK